jgi:hypothetical protein
MSTGVHPTTGPQSSVAGLDIHLDRPGGRVRDGVMEAIRAAIRSGRLVPGTRLPSSRALAADLGVARNTVARAYTELIAEGWLTSQHGSSTCWRAGWQPCTAWKLTAGFRGHRRPRPYFPWLRSLVVGPAGARRKLPVSIHTNIFGTLRRILRDYRANAGFHRIIHRALPTPVGSRDSPPTSFHRILVGRAIHRRPRADDRRRRTHHHRADTVADVDRDRTYRAQRDWSASSSARCSSAISPTGSAGNSGTSPI